jgi:hypothetical protein
MKKLLVASVLALALVSGSQQTASAWSHYKFSIGMNLDWSTGNNSWFWGLFRNGQIPDGYGGGPLGDYYAAPPVTYSQPGFHAPAPTPVQRQSAPGTPSSMMAGYPANYYYYQASYPGSYYPQAQYYPMSYYQPSGFSYYYPMSYGHGFSFGQ